MPNGDSRSRSSAPCLILPPNAQRGQLPRDRAAANCVANRHEQGSALADRWWNFIGKAERGRGGTLTMPVLFTQQLWLELGQQKVQHRGLQNHAQHHQLLHHDKAPHRQKHCWHHISWLSVPDPTVHTALTSSLKTACRLVPLVQSTPTTPPAKSNHARRH